MEDFINRSYTKKELGLMYFPESMPVGEKYLPNWGNKKGLKKRTGKHRKTRE